MRLVHKVKNKTPLDCSGGLYLKASKYTYFLSHYHLCSLKKNPLVLASSGEVSKQLSYLYICPHDGFYARYGELMKKRETDSTLMRSPFSPIPYSLRL